MPPPIARRARAALVIVLWASGSAAATSVGTPAPAPSRRPLATAALDLGLRPRREGDWGAAGAPSVAAARAPFRLLLNGAVVSSRVRAFPVLPGATVRLEAPDAQAPALLYEGGRATPSGEGTWRWVAPAVPGIYALRIVVNADSVDLTALVLHPSSTLHDGVLNGYEIGRYRAKPLRGNPVYAPPTGFVEVSAADRDVLVSPHFTLGQFLCKEAGEPRYLAFSPRLVDKLEAIVGVLVAKGRPAGSLVIMSGFRTPAYNAAIGNRTAYSRHLWGDAADIYVDADGNGVMDDLNGDGRSDVQDARVLEGWIDQAVGKVPLVPGGLAAYRRTAAHGPFVHVDARGFRVRW